MGDVSEYLSGSPDAPWIDLLRPGQPHAEGRCVMLWVQRAQRATGNRAANVAINLANHLRLPVVAVFVLTPSYPGATYRAYRFMAEGLRETATAFRERGVGWWLRAGDPVDLVPRLADELGAAALITDADPLRTGCCWRDEIAARVSIPLVAVASDTIASPSLFPKMEFAARTIRPKLWRAIAANDFLAAAPDRDPLLRAEFGMSDDVDPIALIDTLPLDRTMSASPRFVGGRAEALIRLNRFITGRLATYPDQRNQPERDPHSELSPYLHFGQISPLEVARAAIAARVGDRSWLAPGGIAIGHPDEAVEDAPLLAFLDELVTQRELAINYCQRQPAYDRWQGLPAWGRATLDQHRHDPRPVIMSPDRIEAGQTGDPLWDAAQRQLRHEGWMPNRLRMYWAKQLLQWTAQPEDAFDLAVYLDDRYFLDGRDANGYAGVGWSIGGLHDRPFPPNKPILGLVRPMTAAGMARKFDTAAYIRMVDQRTREDESGADGGSG
ncbi:MAG: deoxyribodipyrimidine photo-lyase [Thermomicrobiales bacterium]